MLKNSLLNLGKDKYYLFIPFLTILVRAIIHHFIPLTYEDAYITFRYAENLANGNGLVYNLGEKVYGTTTPIFAIILAFFKYLGISCITSSLIINLISESITTLVVYKVLIRYSDSLASVIVSLLFVFSPSNISWSIQGMETAFFGAIIALSFYNLYKKYYFFSLLFAFMSAIIRIDGLSVVFVISSFVFIERRLSSIKILLIPLFIFLAWLVFLQIYFGNFLPNSMIAKLILYSGHSSSVLPNFNIVLSKFFLAGYYSSTILTSLFFIGIYVVLKKNIRLLPMIVWFFIYFTALVMSKTLLHGWYLVPPLFVYITVSGLGIVYIFTLLCNKFLNFTKYIKYTLFIIVILFSSLTLKLKLNQMLKEFLYEQTVRKPIGNYLNAVTAVKSTIFLEPIGVIGYFANRYIYDDAALISPVFLEINRLPYNAISVYKKIDLVQPDYLALRDRDLEEFYNSTKLSEDYQLMKNFKDSIFGRDKLDLSMTIFKRKIK